MRTVEVNTSKSERCEKVVSITSAVEKTCPRPRKRARPDTAEVVNLFAKSLATPGKPLAHRNTSAYSNKQNEPTASCETRYFSGLARHNLLNADEEKDLARRAKRGDIAARNRMIEANLRLVVKVAKPYANRDIPMLDLISEGNLGLIHAIDKFQPEKGFRFSTYAIWWIREKIQVAVMRQSNIAYMPIHAVKAQRACLRAQNELRRAQACEPSIVDIAAYCGKKRSEVESLLSRVEKISPIDNDERDTSSRPLRDRLVDTNSIDPADSLANNDMRAALERCLTRLNPKQKSIIVKRYGLNGEQPASLQALSEELGLCRQTIKKLQDAALATLLKELHN